MSPRANHMLTCREMVELVTDYIEGRLGDPERERFEAHIAECGPCATYLEQMRMTITALGRIPSETISPEAERELIEAFRGWRSGS